MKRPMKAWAAPKEPGDGHRKFGSRGTRKFSKLRVHAISGPRLEALLKASAQELAARERGAAGEDDGRR